MENKTKKVKIKFDAGCGLDGKNYYFKDNEIYYFIDWIIKYDEVYAILINESGDTKYAPVSFFDFIRESNNEIINRRKLNILYKLNDKKGTIIIIPIIMSISGYYLKDSDRIRGIIFKYVHELETIISEGEYRDYYEKGLEDIIQKDFDNILFLIKEYWEK